MNKWKEIWNKREADFSLLQKEDPKQVFLELKRIDVFDVTEKGYHLILSGINIRK